MPAHFYKGFVCRGKKKEKLEPESYPRIYFVKAE